MPRKKYKNKTGVRKYGVKSNYTPEALTEALTKIRSGVMSRMEASQHYKIPAVTLFYKLKDKHNKNVGRPVTFTDNEEKYFENHLLMLNEMGVTMNMLDFRLIVKRYLDSNNKRIATFKNNLPGYDWGALFLERHPALKNVIGKSSQTKHAQIDKHKIKKFFDNISKEIDGVSPNNIYSVDELGFNDNPNKHKVVFRRESRHPGYIKNGLKSCYTVAFCGNAAGKILPPYFIFKETQQCSDSIFQVESGFRTAVSSTGWFNKTVFEDWLEFIFLPFVNKRDGKKILFCDNLSAHISPRCMHLCVDNNIKFICLIPNSTYLLQPLDGVFFKTLKSTWKKVLGQYRKTSKMQMVPLSKILFIRLIKITLRNEEILSDHLKAGFRSCGLYPFSPRTVLNKLPYASEADMSESDHEISATYLEINQPDITSLIKDGEFEVEILDNVTEEEMELKFEKRDELQANIDYLKIQPRKRGRPRKNVTKGAVYKNDYPSFKRYSTDEMYDSDDNAKKKIRQNSRDSKRDVFEKEDTKENKFEPASLRKLKEEVEAKLHMTDVSDLSRRSSDNEYTDIEVLDWDLLA